MQAGSRVSVCVSVRPSIVCLSVCLSVGRLVCRTKIHRHAIGVVRHKIGRHCQALDGHNHDRTPPLETETKQTRYTIVLRYAAPKLPLSPRHCVPVETIWLGSPGGTRCSRFDNMNDLSISAAQDIPFFRHGTPRPGAALPVRWCRAPALSVAAQPRPPTDIMSLLLSAVPKGSSAVNHLSERRVCPRPLSHSTNPRSLRLANGRRMA